MARSGSKRREDARYPVTLLERGIWLLLVAAALYLFLTLASGVITAEFYDLVWATMEP